MTYNTGNPIGSTDARDRLDNSENMDILENSTTLNAHPDRLGVMRKTRKGMESEHDNQISAHESEHDAQIAAHEAEFTDRIFKMAFTPVGTFTDGATLTDARQTLLWEVSEGGDGHYYSWAGSFGTSGKAVTAGSSPSPIAAGSWVDRTDDSLRDEIRETVFQNMKRLAAEAGYNLVDGSFQTGAVTVNQNDVVWDWPSGKYYGGVIGSVSAGSTPATSGAWVDRTDWSLRAEITPFVTEALRRSYADAGYNLVDGSFESGGTLTNTNDVLLHKASGIAYSWGGTLPITVAPNSTPTPIGSDGWIDRSAVTLRSDVTAHETKLGAHAISGVAGLQDALNGKASASELSSISSSVAAIGTRVTALETIKSYCLVNALGTGAPNELVSAELPANIAISTRYVLANPFGANVPVIGWAEVFYNGKWSKTGFVYSSSTNGGYGVSFNFVQGEGIVIQTGTAELVMISSRDGGGHGKTNQTIVTSVPCRVFIQKLGA